MLTADAVGAALAELGTEVCFGVVGSGNFQVTNALTAAGSRFVPARYESDAVTAADAYARLTGQIGVCTVHQGPGLTNQDMVGKLVQENRSLRAQNLKLSRQADQLAAGWDQIKKLARSAPRARGRGRS